jgi:hypothetical protein
MTDRWFDDAAGPVVRPYAMTRGRTRSEAHGAGLDLIALVIADMTPDRAAGPEPQDGEGPADENAAGDGDGRSDVSPYAGNGADSDAAVGRAHDSAGSGGEDAGEHAGENTDVLADPTLTPEHVHIVIACRRDPQSVAELAADLDLPVGVVRVLIGDLIDAEWVRVSRPVPPAELPDESILREVIDGLRAL